MLQCLIDILTESSSECAATFKCKKKLIVLDLEYLEGALIDSDDTCYNMVPKNDRTMLQNFRNDSVAKSNQCSSSKLHGLWTVIVNAKKTYQIVDAT